MKSHTTSKIYQRTLGAQGEYAEACERLRVEYEKTRNTMSGILSKITVGMYQRR